MRNKARQLLAELERSGNYVFHGSSKRIDIFEPRQATNRKNGKPVPDDRPGIHASTLIDIAIFMAIVSEDNCHKKFHGSFSYYGEGNLVFEVTKETLDGLIEPVGYVYIFDRRDFKKRNAIEYIFYSPIKPIAHVEVGIDDMPAGIKLIS